MLGRGPGLKSRRVLVQRWDGNSAVQPLTRSALRISISLKDCSVAFIGLVVSKLVGSSAEVDEPAEHRSAAIRSRGRSSRELIGELKVGVEAFL